MSDDPKSKEDQKKDLTGIFELPQTERSSKEEEDPFAVNVPPPIEQIDSFDSIEDLGMMDHPEPPSEDAAQEAVEETKASDTSLETAHEDPFQSFVVPSTDGTSTTSEPSQDFNSSFDSSNSSANDGFEVSPQGDASDPFAMPIDSFQNSVPDQFKIDPSAEASNANDPFASSPSDETRASDTHALPPLDAAPPMDYMQNIKSYSQKTQETAFDPGTRYPFHLLIQGTFDPYARDKLLLFITENPVGTSSSELDLQINGGRVLMPRISEFAGIKLIQDLRDSGLSFSLKPSSIDADEVVPNAPSLSIHYSEKTQASETKKNILIPVYPKEMVDQKLFQVMDTLQMIQFLKAEILEVEKSELFQELIDRMTAAMKRKASVMGAIALTSVQHKITPLRLPSQYQVELSATLLKKL